MKTAGRENPNHGAVLPRNRAHGAASQNRSRSIKWAAKQEKFQPKEMCFFLTSAFIERFSKFPCFNSLVLGINKLRSGGIPHSCAKSRNYCASRMSTVYHVDGRPSRA